MNACPDKHLLIHGLADGEVDAANALALEAHLAGCDGCRAEYERVMSLRSRLREQDLSYYASERLRRDIAAMLAAESSADDKTPATIGPLRPKASGMARHVLNWRWASGAMTGLAAGLALMVAIPRSPERQGTGDLVGNHVRSLMAHHLTDIETSDKHVVKPWFNGRIDFAPPVPDLVADGFPLVGGRLDFVDGRDVAALVYRRRLHVINVFVAPARLQAAGTTGDETKEGYNILRWTAGDLAYSAVSDLNGKELRQFRQLFIAAAAG
jgi:anti-sigma factor RsiW